MILTATINEVKRRITFDNPQAVVAVKGDYEVNGIAFAFPAIYEDDFDLSTAVKTVYYKATDGIIYNHVVTDTDTDTGYPLWVFKDEINKGAYGDVEFALVCDKVEGGNIVKRWVSMITAFRVQKSIEIDESEQEENEQTYSERLAYLMTQMANMQATVTGLASGAPTPESLVANMQEGHIYVYTGTETGYTAGHVYYYVNGTLTDGGQYGGIALDATLTSSAMAAPASEVGQIKEDLDDVNERLEEVEDELGIIPPDTYRGTIEQANTYTRIAENLSFDLATGYKFTFKISAPLNTDVYFNVMRSEGNQLFSKTISPGGTSAERVYTTSASVPVTAGYILVRANATNVNVEVEIEPATGTPSRIDTLEQTAQTQGAAITGLADRTTVLESEVRSIDVSVNRLNPFTVTTGKYIKMDGTTGNSASLLYTDYIKVNPGERINLVNDGVCDTNTRFRYLTAYDSEKVVIPASGKETSYRYDVPEGVSYIIMTLYAADYAGGKLAINVNAVLDYSAYGDAFPIVSFAQKLKQYPYSALPDYVLGGAWYKPLGSLSKGYFCFVTDDGRIGMNEYTIPTLVIGKGVKCTFAIFSASEVMADAEKIAVVKDAVDNYGCSVAQHGGNRWTQFDEYQLNEFFDTEKAFFDGIGIEVRGAVIPEHYNSQLIYAVAGGKYGVVRSGYDGHIYPTVCPYADYSNGPRSNLYGLTAYNIVDKTLANNKAAVDSAIANHRLMIVYIHENSLDAAKKAVIEGLMDYVIETGITQVTLGDIPNLI